MDDLKIVFSDVDGTLLDSRQEITPRTLRALKLLQKRRSHSLLSRRAVLLASNPL